MFIMISSPIAPSFRVLIFARFGHLRLYLIQKGNFEVSLRASSRCPNFAEIFLVMDYHATPYMLFIGIVLGMTCISFLLCGGKKAFFEPYTGPDES
jgi:hypothetical protein